MLQVKHLQEMKEFEFLARSLRAETTSIAQTSALYPQMHSTTVPMQTFVLRNLYIQALRHAPTLAITTRAPALSQSIPYNANIPFYMYLCNAPNRSATINAIEIYSLIHHKRRKHKHKRLFTFYKATCQNILVLVLHTMHNSFILQH